MWPDDQSDEVDFDLAEISAPDSHTAEPLLATGPYFIDFDDVVLLDPARGASEPEEIEELLEPPPRVRPFGLAGSFGMHALPLLLLLTLTASAVPPLGGAVPVQLVLEQPTTESPTSEAEAAPMAAVQDQPAEPPAAPPQPSDIPPPVPTAATPPPPPPVATPTPVPPPQPPPLKIAKPVRAAVTRPKAAPPKPEARLAASTVVETKPAQTAPAATPAHQSSTGQYLSYLVTLTRRHLDLLPADLVGNRRGKTVIAVRVEDDGTITHTRIAASSNYPDIDARIEQMVVAVGHFPPLPEQLRGQSIELDLNLNFPDVFRP